jgi:hypothetical protein
VSAAALRSAAATWFATDSIPGLVRVYKEQPWFVDGSVWNLGTSVNGEPIGSGAVAFVHISEQYESRLTVPAITGSKMLTYKCALVVLYQYVIPSGVVTPAAEDDWVLGLDALLDGVVARLRVDPTIGTAGSPVFQAGQDPDDDKIIRDLPRRYDGVIGSWNVVEFTANEIVTA